MNYFDGIIVLATRENILYVAVIAVCRVRVLQDKMKLIVDQIKFIFVTVYYVNNPTYVNRQLLKKLKSWQIVSATVSHHQAKTRT